MKKEIFFLLGRPGCGKSFLYTNVFKPVLREKKDYAIKRFDDFPILQTLLDEDKTFSRHRRKEGGFEVTDWTIIDDVLKELDKLLRKNLKEDTKIFAEFARADYFAALKNFSREIREKSLLIYISAPFGVCMSSNLNRFKNRKHPDDDHIVPTTLMETYYKTDDLEKPYGRQGDSAGVKFNDWDLAVFENAEHKESVENKKKRFRDILKEYDL